MAEKKNSITRAQALEFAYNVIYSITNGDGFEQEEDNATAAAVLPVLQNMHAQLVKPRAKAVTKARLANENLAKKVAELVGDNHDTAVTTKDVVALGLPEITTTQKAAAVLRVACELGKFEKVVDGKKVGYKKVVTE